MIDLTPLDVRQKRGDFKKAMRGYETQEVDTFLEIVSDRLEELVKEVLTLRERSTVLQAQVELQIGRERAVQDALVTAQSLRDEIKGQARRESEAILREADAEARRLVNDAETVAKRLVADAERRLEEQRAGLADLERRRHIFLMSMRRLLERGLDAVALEQGEPQRNQPLDLELMGGQRRGDGAQRTPPPDFDDDPRVSGGIEKGAEIWLALDEPGAPEPDPEPAS